jgi:hypothetical protein
VTAVRSRFGNGLRVYLRRPWFSSGQGELLGVVFGPDLAMSDIPGSLLPYVTQWGMDPMWLSKPAAPALTIEQFAIPKSEWPAHFNGSVTLDELAGQAVAVAGFPVEYDPRRGLWFSDIELDPGNSAFDPQKLRLNGGYFPFVRLALARFQPKSVAGAHVSRVVRADFAQLVPDRRATFVMSAAGAGAKVTVTIEGLKHDTASIGITTQFDVTVEELVDPASGELGWEPAAVNTDYDVNPDTPTGSQIWQGKLTLKKPFATGKFRVAVREAERHPTPGKDNSELRLVYADNQGIEL